MTRLIVNMCGVGGDVMRMPENHVTGKGLGRRGSVRRCRVFSLLVVLLCLALAAWPGNATAQDEVTVKGGSAIYPLLTVNIADGDRLARLYIGFEAQCQDEEGARLAAAPQTREAVLLFLRDKSATQLTGALARRRLKDELIAVMNKAIGAPRVVRLYYLQFVIR